MRRFWVILALCCGAVGCERTYSYLYYEMVHSPEQIKVGDMVVLETFDGVSIRGTLTRVNPDEVVVTTEADQRRRVPWRAIRLLHKVERVRVRSG